ncbi:MAG: putative TonB protein, partial [Phenylobacterium sp.]|nr:putative TonB protein [Phenylobacterium sp.]
GHGTVQVMLACVVQQGGGVSDCTVQREQPAGIGVGQAALALATHFRLTTWTAEGLPTVGGTVKIPLRYEGGDTAPAPAKP